MFLIKLFQRLFFIRDPEQTNPTQYDKQAGRVEVTITIFSSKHILTTRQNLYKKTKSEMFEINLIKVRPHLDVFIDFAGCKT